MSDIDDLIENLKVKHYLDDDSKARLTEASSELIFRFRRERVEAAECIERLRDALLKVKSYNVSIAADEINYRPEDHISVIDEALRDEPKDSSGTIRFADKHGEWITMSFAEHEEYVKPARLLWTERIWAQRIPEDFRFEIGKKYLSLGGKIVTIVRFNDRGDCMQGDDCGPFGGLGWRYCRPEDMGRATGSTWDSDNNLIPFEIKD